MSSLVNNLADEKDFAYYKQMREKLQTEIICKDIPVKTMYLDECVYVCM